MDDRIRQRFILLLVAALLALVWTYRSTFYSMAGKWLDDVAFTYGFVVAPISLWLVLQKRRSLAAVTIAPSWLGVIGMLGLGMLWVVAQGTGVLVLAQVAVVGMVSATVLAMLGPKATRLFAFPLAFLFFMVPFGRAVVPGLMQATAQMATLALQWSGIPVYRSHMYITIPGGSFEVARACSGVAFLMTALVLGVLYAYLNYTTWKKRLLCVLVAVCVPVLANGVRVYLTIAAAHLTDMRVGPGVEHRTFGQVFFVLVMLGTFWLGRRWQDTRAVEQPPGIPATVPDRRLAWPWAPVPVALLLMLLPPSYYAALAHGVHTRNRNAADVSLPTGSRKWAGPVAAQHAWTPLYRNGLAQKQATYRDPRGSRVDAFVAVYGLGVTSGSEMISFGNVLYAGEHESLAKTRHRRVDLGDGTTLTVREVVAPEADHDYLVWHWFVVGERRTTSPFKVKALEAAAWVTRTAATERIVTVATPVDPEARERLESFVLAFPQCITSGFAAGACGP